MNLDPNNIKNTEFEKYNFTQDDLTSFNDIPSLAPIYKIIRKSQEFVQDADPYNSKYFGIPYLKNLEDIPKDSDGFYQVMIAQINCKDFKRLNQYGGLSYIKESESNIEIYDKNLDIITENLQKACKERTQANFSKLPEEGLLQFWVCINDDKFINYEGNHTDANRFRVVYIQNYSQQINAEVVDTYFKQIEEKINEAIKSDFRKSSLVKSTKECIYLDFELSFDMYSTNPILSNADPYIDEDDIEPELFDAFIEKYLPDYVSLERERVVATYLAGSFGKVSEAKDQLIANFPNHHRKFSTISGYGKTSQEFYCDNMINILKLDWDGFWHYRDCGEVNFLMNYKDFENRDWQKVQIEAAGS
jgi:uncharacterized protein YwqG